MELVDCAIGNGDRQTAISYLTLDGGHGTISSGWKIDCAIQPWRHGKRVFDCISRSSNESSAKTLAIKVAGEGADFFKWGVIIGETVWDVYESSVRSANDLETLLSKHSMFQYNEQNSRL